MSEWNTLTQTLSAMDAAVVGQAQMYVDQENAIRESLTTDTYAQRAAANEAAAEHMAEHSVYAPDTPIVLKRMIPAGLNDLKDKTVDMEVTVARDPGWLVAEIHEKDIASMQILDRKGTRILPSYTKFYIESAQKGTQEKVQIVETFEDPNYYFYGSRPRIYQLSGTLRNDRSNNWAKQFEFIWQTLLKGTRLAEMKAKAYLNIDEVMWVGYPTTMNSSAIAGQNNSIKFSMSFLVVRDVISGPFDPKIVQAAKAYTKDTEGIGSVKSRLGEMDGIRKVSTTELAYFEFPTI